MTTPSDQKKLPIKIEKHEAITEFPRLSLFMGLPKIGKSTAMAKVPNGLVCDLEGKGYDGIDTPALVRTPTLKDLQDACIYFFSADNTDFKVLIIDHIRTLTSFYAKKIISSSKTRVTYLEEIEFGRGASQLRNSIDSFIKWLNAQLAANPGKYVFLVGHAIDRNNEVRLDVDGKNETMILGLVDAVGFIDREEDVTTVDFGAKRGLEFGSRNAALASYKGELNWEILFKLAQNNGKHE